VSRHGPIKSGPAPNTPQWAWLFLPVFMLVMILAYAVIVTAAPAGPAWEPLKLSIAFFRKDWGTRNPVHGCPRYPDPGTNPQ